MFFELINSLSQVNGLNLKC